MFLRLYHSKGIEKWANIKYLGMMKQRMSGSLRLYEMNKKYKNGYYDGRN